MKYLISLILAWALPVMAQTTTITTETIREETTVVTVVQNESSNTTVRSSVPVVYKCNGQNCTNPR